MLCLLSFYVLCSRGQGTYFLWAMRYSALCSIWRKLWLFCFPNKKHFAFQNVLEILGHCYRLNVWVPQNSYIEVLTPNVMI